MTTPDTTVVENAERERFEIHVDGALAGYAEYRTAKGLRIFSHTQIEPDYEGRGLGSVLIAAALAATRERGDKVLPLCPFVKAYIERHPKELDLVRATDRTAFGLPAA